MEKSIGPLCCCPWNSCGRIDQVFVFFYQGVYSLVSWSGGRRGSEVCPKIHVQSSLSNKICPQIITPFLCYNSTAPLDCVRNIFLLIWNFYIKNSDCSAVWAYFHPPESFSYNCLSDGDYRSLSKLILVQDLMIRLPSGCKTNK